MSGKSTGRVRSGMRTAGRQAIGFCGCELKSRSKVPEVGYWVFSWIPVDSRQSLVAKAARRKNQVDVHASCCSEDRMTIVYARRVANKVPINV